MRKAACATCAAPGCLLRNVLVRPPSGEDAAPKAFRNGLSADERTQLNPLVRHQLYQKGEMIFRQGTVISGCCVLCDGKAKLARYTSRGQKQIIRFLSPGEFFGELGLWGAKSSSVSARALTESVVGWLSPGDFQELLKRHPTIALEFHKRLAQEVDELRVRLTELAYLGTRERLIKLLLELGEKYGRKGDHGLSIKVKIISCAIPYLKSTNIAVWIKAGPKYEVKSIHGASHFVEHLLFTGTKKYRSRNDLVGAIETYGGQLNAFVEREATCFWVRIPTAHVLQCVEVLSDMLRNPLFEEHIIEKERKVIIEELKKHMDDPREWVRSMLDELLWPDHPLGGYVGGSINTIKRIQRSDLLQFMQTHYRPNNMVISIVSGDLPPALIRLLKMNFATFMPHYQRFTLPPIPPPMKKRLCFLERPTHQYHFALGIQALPRMHPDRYALELITIILGKGMSSRLFDTLRSKGGMLYSIHTHLECHEETGAFKIYGGISNSLVSAIKLILNVVHSMQTCGISEAELEKAKQFYKGRLILGLEDARNLAFWLGESLLLDGEYYTLETILQKAVDQVTRENINRVLNSLFQVENFRLALIGPQLDDNVEEAFLMMKGG